MKTPKDAAIADLVDASDRLSRAYNTLRDAGETELAVLVRDAQRKVTSTIGKIVTSDDRAIEVAS